MSLSDYFEFAEANNKSLPEMCEELGRSKPTVMNWLAIQGYEYGWHKRREAA